MSIGNILVVDDDSAIVDLVTATLEDEGYAVVTAVDGAALALAHTCQPAVILLDLRMPGMDGPEVSRRLRADPCTRAIPIIVMSSESDLPALTAPLPINALLPKPFDLDVLCALVAHWAAGPAAGRLAWRGWGAQWYAFDRTTHHVVGWYTPDQYALWWAYVRWSAATYGPFASAAAARAEVERRVLA